MVVALWRRGNRCRAAMDVQTLRRRALCVLRYRIVIRHLLGDGTLRLALGGSGAIAGPEARAAIGGSVSSSRRPRPTLASRCSSDSLDFCGCSSSASPRACRISAWAGIGSSSNFGIRGRAERRTFGRLRDEGFGRRRLLGLDAGGLVVIREQGRLLRDRANRDVAIGRRLDRRLLRRSSTAAAIAASAARSTLLDARCGAAARRLGSAAARACGAAAGSSFWARSARRALSARRRAVSSARRLSGEVVAAVAAPWSRPPGRRRHCARSAPARCRWRRRRRG